MQSLFKSSTPSDPITHALADAPVVQTAGPWKPVVTMAVGGLSAVGFDRASDTLLVCSANGQSVIDTASGDVLYRNRDANGLDVSTLKGTRLDHPADERFDMAGLFGGGLRTVTDDGWSVAHLQGHAILHPPGASIFFAAPKWQDHNKNGTFYLLDRSREDIRAFGFSWTSHSLVLATPSTLMLWHRPCPLKL